jgi:uncharacterized protein (DUF302 family)
MIYGFSTVLDLPHEEAIARVTEELRKEGFGILTTIDVQATMKEKLDVEFKKYVILGACNPPFAYQALQAENEIGLLLPCNVIVYEQEDKKTVVSIFDPMVMTVVLGNEKVEPIAREVKERLKRVMSNL